MLRDSFGRIIKNIRISVTQRCNFRCFYCHREGEENPSYCEMLPEEIERIVRVAASLGINEVKLTGGEPLLRDDIVEIVDRISRIPGINDISMTTNGFFLEDYADDLKRAGLMRVNVSLDTLDPEKFKMITGVDGHESVIRGIIKAVNADLKPVKVNMVILRGINEDEVSSMITFARDNNLILQIIEFERPRIDAVYQRYHIDIADIEDKIKKRAVKTTVRSMHHRRKYTLDDHTEVEFVRPMHNTDFCLHCSRIRLTSDGKLKPCLFKNDNLIDVLGPIRRGVDDNYLKDLFIEAVKRRRPYFYNNNLYLS
ncbi:MAG: GTP 3',8-cyclase MoaA [Candidatus Bathyarchaeia archaeon]